MEPHLFWPLKEFNLHAPLESSGTLGYISAHRIDDGRIWLHTSWFIMREHQPHRALLSGQGSVVHLCHIEWIFQFIGQEKHNWFFLASILLKLVSYSNLFLFGVKGAYSGYIYFKNHKSVSPQTLNCPNFY